MKKIIMLIFIVVFVSTVSLATNTSTTTIESVLGNSAQPTPVDNNISSRILGFMQFVGFAIAIGMLIYIGIKYVSSAADERANLKGALVKYVIGAILIVAASKVVGWIISIGASVK